MIWGYHYFRKHPFFCGFCRNPYLPVIFTLFKWIDAFRENFYIFTPSPFANPNNTPFLNIRTLKLSCLPWTQSERTLENWAANRQGPLQARQKSPFHIRATEKKQKTPTFHSKWLVYRDLYIYIYIELAYEKNPHKKLGVVSHPLYQSPPTQGWTTPPARSAIKPRHRATKHVPPQRPGGGWFHRVFSQKAWDKFLGSYMTFRGLSLLVKLLYLLDIHVQQIFLQ